ncbi:MAG: glycosyltransferase family 2 protein [Candidatus Paceibacterota bacterium]
MTSNGQNLLVSIIILTYNRANYLGQAIGSVLTQTYANFELIILDDGSTDDTEKVVIEFNDSRIKYVKDSVNRGIVYRRNESLKLAKGKYLAILDSDDVWLSPNKLQKQVELMELNPKLTVVGTYIKIIDADGTEVSKNKYGANDKTIRKNILIRNQFANSSVLMQKTAVEKTQGYRPYAYAEELDLFLQLGTLGELQNIPEYLTGHRVHGSRETATKKLQIPLIVLSIIKPFKNIYPNYKLAWIKFNLYYLARKIQVALERLTN